MIDSKPVDSNAMDRSPLFDAERSYFVRVAVGEHSYAFEISSVREVLRWVDTVPLPNAPVLIEGIADVREAVVPIIDLGRVLRGVAVERSDAARTILVEACDMFMGLRVEGVFGVIQVGAHAVENVPMPNGSAGRELVCGVVRQSGGRPVLLLSVKKLVELVGSVGRESSLGVEEALNAP